MTSVKNKQSSPNIKMNKSRTIRWAGHVARMEKMRNVNGVRSENLDERVLLVGKGVYGRIILKLS
jgi:hypothetical protein